MEQSDKMTLDECRWVPVQTLNCGFYVQNEGRELTKEEKQRLRKEKKQQKKNKKDEKGPPEKEKEKPSVPAPSKPATQSPSHKGECTYRGFSPRIYTTDQKLNSS